MKKVVLTFGSIAGAILVIMMFITMPIWQESMDFSKGELVGYTTMVVALSMVFFGIKSYRDNYEGGIITFGKAFKVGILITLMASAMYVLGWMIYSNTIGSGFMDQYYEYSIQELKDSGAPTVEIDEKIEEMEGFKDLYKNPLVQIGVTFLEIFPIGLLITLLCAAVLKKK